MVAATGSERLRMKTFAARCFFVAVLLVVFPWYVFTGDRMGWMLWASACIQGMAVVVLAMCTVHVGRPV